MNPKQFLASNGWLTTVPAEMRTAILDNCIQRKFAKGEWFYRSDDLPGGIMGLASGKAMVISDEGPNPHTPIHMFVPGQWTGVAGTLLDYNNVTGVLAKTDCVVLYLQKAVLLRILSDRPELWRVVAEFLALGLHTAILAHYDLLISDAPRRIAATLLRIAGCRGPMAKNVPVSIPLTQVELCEMVNLSRTVVGAALRDFEAKGAICQSYGSIQVDPIRLSLEYENADVTLT